MSLQSFPGLRRRIRRRGHSRRFRLRGRARTGTTAASARPPGIHRFRSLACF